MHKLVGLVPAPVHAVIKATKGKSKYKDILKFIRVSSIKPVVQTVDLISSFVIKNEIISFLNVIFDRWSQIFRSYHMPVPVPSLS